MAAELMQIALGNSTTILVAVVAFVLIALIIVFLVRSNAGKQEREIRMQARLMEMEREAQFAAAADRAPRLRVARDVASNLAGLFAEYLSIQVHAVYAGRETDSQLSSILNCGNSDDDGSLHVELPDSMPAALLLECTHPMVENLASITGQGAANYLITEEDGTAQAGEKAQETPPDNRAEQQETSSEAAHDVRAVRGPQEVLLLPWRATLPWNGLIMASLPAGMTAGELEAYRQPVARLTERLAIALELEANDAALKSIEQLAHGTTEFARSVISRLEDASPLNTIVRDVVKLVGADSAALWRVDQATSMVTMVAAEGLKSPEFLPLPLGRGLAGSVAQTRESLAIENAPADPRCIFPREARESGIVSYLGAPLAGEDETLGVIEVHSATPRVWTRNERRALESAAAIVSELIRTTDTRGNRLRIESAYLGLSEALQRLRSADELKEAVVEVLGHALRASRVIVVEFNEEGQTEPVKQEHRQPTVKSALEAAFEEGLVGAVIERGTSGPIAITDSRAQSIMGPERAADLGVLSELVLPIRVDGQTLGMVYVHQCDRVRDWEREEIEFAERVGRQLSLSLSNLRALEQAFKDAQARADANQMTGATSTEVQELRQKIESLERVLEHSRTLEEQSRAMLAWASALEAKARAEADVARRSEADLRTQVQGIDEDRKRMQNSAQQLLEINRLKSEFIVNAGREIEASLQSVLGLAELLERGSYGNLSAEQREAVHGLYTWARRIKSDVDWLIEYGSARSRRLEPGNQG